ncbi:VOC family protein [Demequina activiva]|uniref:VOC family protein n=1 Tax=Demequina activiva TaxID=1582364 RepID=UPI0019447671|nr:VOC family protein [Demequina activiva]
MRSPGPSATASSAAARSRRARSRRTPSRRCESREGCHVAATDLAEDLGRPRASLGTGAITLAQNYPSQAEVDERFASALEAGATEIRAPVATEWGGYSGYVADPDGHVWELAVNPFWTLADDGSVTIPAHLPEA